MAAAAGITTSGQPPTATVNIQPGMNVQPVVLVDQNGNYVTPGGSQTTAGSLATTTVPVNVAAATAPTSGQVLTATSGTTATWQTSSSGFANPMTTLGDMITENSVPTAARLAGNTTSTQMFLAQTGTGSASALPTWSTIATSNLPVIPIAGGGSGQTTATSAFNALSPMTTVGDLIAENATPAAVRVAGNTTATKNFLTQTGSGSASALPVWGTIAAADLPTGTTSTKGALQLDGTAGDITALGVQAAGAIGKAADAGHVHPTTGVVTSVAGTDTSVVVTGGSTSSPTIATNTLDVIAAQHPAAANWSNNNHKITSLANGTTASDAMAYGQTPWALGSEPSGTTAARFPSAVIGTSSLAAFNTTGQVALASIGLPQGLVVSNLSLLFGGTAANGPTHFWMALCDSTLHVLAVSADQTSAAQPVSTVKTLAVTTDGSHPYTVASSGAYYIAASSSAGTAPTAAGFGIAGSATGVSPVICGTGGTQAAPPAVAAQLNSGTVTFNVAMNFQAWTS